ncbi:MAG: D-glycero-beta-D-manno-heptose 1,7-bisphosphate 7-phosphatase [Proteobacteria bacterium]|nr:D-glycero-beta-D-manno-heptose 1,7-bisphosphate 7-phosphatase [Pseudomonadota bacterium]
MNKTVFIDRDGVINRDSPDYITSVEKFEFLPGSLDAIRTLTLHHYDIIIITNQSVIGRGMITSDTLDQIFMKMKKGVEAHGGRLKDIFFCPHTPDDKCVCRKPKPGMIFSARDKHGIDLKQSCMIGDSAKDILCSKNAGIGRAILVRTGNGPKALLELQGKSIVPDHVANDLLDAADWLIDKDHSRDLHT